MATAIAIVAIAVLQTARRPAAASPLWFSVAAPENAILSGDPALSAISPNGRNLVFVAADSNGTTQLWLRSFEGLNAHPLPGTENAEVPFWSPDSKSVGFFADGKLKKVAISGGAPDALCDAKSGRGGAWSRNGVIVFAPTGQGPL